MGRVDTRQAMVCGLAPEEERQRQFIVVVIVGKTIK